MINKLKKVEYRINWSKFMKVKSILFDKNGINSVCLTFCNF